jgi:hypothetical protein
MMGARHPPMIGVLPISCVLALIWAQEENLIATSILRLLAGGQGW